MPHELLGLRQIPESRWREFGERVAAAKGKVILLVHPHYTSQVDPRYARTIGKLLAQKSIPLVILEEQPSWQKNEGKYPAHAIVVPTPANHPDAILEKETESKRFLSEADHKELSEKLEAAGAKTVRIGGMESKSTASNNSFSLSRSTRQREADIVNEHELRMGKNVKGSVISWGCVGLTYVNMISSGKFSVVKLIPSALTPELPSYYKFRGKKQ